MKTALFGLLFAAAFVLTMTAASDFDCHDADHYEYDCAATSQKYYDICQDYSDYMPLNACMFYAANMNDNACRNCICPWMESKGLPCNVPPTTAN